MGYTIQYTGTKADMMTKGLEDAKEWYGTKQYNRIMTALVSEIGQKGRKWLARAYPLLLSLSGLGGVPARAMALEALRRAATQQRLEAEGLWAK